MKNVLLTFLVIGLAGCVSVNGYSKFFTQVRAETPTSIKNSRANPPPKKPLVMHVSKFRNPKPLYRQGYVAIGYSSFNSGHSEPDSGAIEQAKKVGADLVVIINPHYTGTIKSEIPLTLPTSNTSYTHGSATAYGAGGPITAYGNSTTTTYGNKTTYIPMSTRRYDYGAVYFIKSKYTLGVHWRPLNKNERIEIESNSGIYIQLVVNGSPAYRADILPGDIILAINGNKIHEIKDAARIIKHFQGQKITFTIYRNGHDIKKWVQL